MYSGLSERSIHLSDLESSPGAGSGREIDGEIHPALPDEQAAPSRPRSITVTAAPFLTR
jgi:hypothetical protein